MMDWMADFYKLPSKFSFTGSDGVGGGSIQNSGTDAIFNTMIAARFLALKADHGFGFPDKQEFGSETFGRMGVRHPALLLQNYAAIASKEAHTSFIKAAKLALLDTYLDTETTMTYDSLYRLHSELRSAGRRTIYALLSIGTPNTCAVDKIPECAQFCQEVGIWVHVNASFAGNAFVLDDYAYLRDGLEHADSINISPYKMMLCAPDLALLYVGHTQKYTFPFLLDAEYLLNVHANSKDKDVKLNTIEYRNYGVPLTRRMRGLKLFFVLQMFGAENLRNTVAAILSTSETMKHNILRDSRFEVLNENTMGFVVFRQLELV